MSEDNSLLIVKNLRMIFITDAGAVRALDGVDLSVGYREVLGVVGESGAGKSALGLTIMRLIPSPPGRILEGSSIIFKGIDLLKLSEEEMTRVRGTGISMIFQEPMTSLNPVYTIGDQIKESIRLRITRSKKERPRGGSLDKLDGGVSVEEELLEALRLVRIPDPEKIAKSYPHELSGGMRQRAMIAMVLAAKPSLLIADEPTTALDVTTQAQILKLLRDLIEEVGASILFITHDFGVIGDIADRVAVMYAGNVVEVADVYDLFRRPSHPYTIGLMESIPRLTGGREELPTLKGSMPSLISPPPGCKFHPRCPHAFDRCRREPPKLVEIGRGRWVACHLFEEDKP
ncbi:MAG: ABC transporter ATP-binding protein [Candidatus Bathyarchaeia archaeon]